MLKLMSFETVFKIFSYLAVFSGFLSLWLSGTFGPIGTLLFAAVLIGGWFLEDTKWQISERLGTALIVLALPAFYLGWRFQIFTFVSSELMVAGILSRLILTLTGIKLLQKKSDRDWIFLYLMAFFEVLLTAGLSISATYLASFLFYLLVTVCTVIAFEIRKTNRAVLAITPANRPTFPAGSERQPKIPVRKLPAIALSLIFFIMTLAAPLFFLLPRVGGAGFGSNGSGVSTSSGFSDTVRLGGIGRIQQNDETVMRIRVEDRELIRGSLYWRGVALDTFDNRAWSKSKRSVTETFAKGEKDFIQIGYATGRDSLVRQTIYLEPIDSPILFGLNRPVAYQGGFSLLFRDPYGAVSYSRTGYERQSYKLVSDTGLPPVEALQLDRSPYIADVGNYLQLPERLDPRIAELAQRVSGENRNRYDRAKAIETYLQNNFGYTLELKAGGDDPLADFLFNVREGHCEYFATSMAIMLRTQGIATRIVNGFQQGEYNETADVYVVKQLHAHSWVEVYFPGEDSWIPFDPTPFAGQPAAYSTQGIAGQLNSYIEALETLWIQYFVAFDDQEQRSLFRSVRNGFVDYQQRSSGYLSAYQKALSDWWVRARGDEGAATSFNAIGWGAGILTAAVFVVLLAVLLLRKIKSLGFWRRLLSWTGRSKGSSVVDFYERMLKILEGKGFVRKPHQTPLEFAYAVGSPEAIKITNKYHRVRFGEKYLTGDESDEIENWLKEISSTSKND